MSIIFGVCVGIFLMYFPMIMTIYYKSRSIVVLLTFILCFIGMFTAFIPSFLAFIIAIISVGFYNSLKSLLFVVLLIAISWLLFAAEVTAFISLLGAS